MVDLHFETSPFGVGTGRKDLIPICTGNPGSIYKINKFVPKLVYKFDLKTN